MQNIDFHRHTIAVLVDNEFGVLARVVGLFSGRGYNIESLTVAKVDDDENLSRITIVTSGTEMVIAQIKAQLERLVPVHKIADLTIDGPSVEREMALVKVECKGEKRLKRCGWRIFSVPVPLIPLKNRSCSKSPEFVTR
nr:acetolactate synthase small subunit [Sneathiella glossodoripedis]